MTEVHVGPTGGGLLVAEPPRRAFSARAGQAGPVTVDSVIARSVNAQTFWKTRKRDIRGLGDRRSNRAHGSWRRGTTSPQRPPPLVPIRAEPGAEPGEGSGSCVFASQVSLHVPKTVLGELDCPIKDGKKSVSEVLCMSVCGGCVCVKDAKELSLHLLYGWRA